MTGKMETPFYHDDTPPGSTAPPLGFGHLSDYERYHGHKMSVVSKKHGFSLQGGGGGSGGGSAAGLKLLHGGGGLHPGANGGLHTLQGLGGNANVALMAAAAAAAGDMNLLKLCPPDLEHLILQSNQGLQGAAGPFHYRSQATNEQEGFADGFVKALADLHKQNQLVGGGPMSPGGASSSSAASLQAAYQRNLMPGGMAEMPVYTNLGSYNPGGQIPGGVASAYAASAGAQMGYGGSGHHQPHGRGLMMDAPQTVPEVPRHDPTGSSPPSLSPIDLETQERIKAERKKLRNRIAASKCRKRKLERISRLEDKVKVLKTQNSDLASTASVLREQVAQLKQKVMNHVTNGCQIAAVGGGAKAGAARSGDGGAC